MQRDRLPVKTFPIMDTHWTAAKLLPKSLWMAGSAMWMLKKLKEKRNVAIQTTKRVASSSLPSFSVIVRNADLHFP